MAQRGQAHARRRRSADYAIDWTMTPGDWMAKSINPEWDEVRYDDVLRPALRVRATLVLDDDGDPAALTNIIRDDVRN